MKPDEEREDLNCPICIPQTLLVLSVSICVHLWRLFLLCVLCGSAVNILVILRRFGFETGYCIGGFARLQVDVPPATPAEAGVNEDAQDNAVTGRNGPRAGGAEARPSP